MPQQGSRDYLINGDTMVYVKGNGALGALDNLNTGNADPGLWELGLASEGIQIHAKFQYSDVQASQFGDLVPVEVRTKLIEAEIYMKLVHFDRGVLEACIVESTGGVLDQNDDSPDPSPDGWISPAGTFLGGGKSLWQSGCHYISVGLSSPTEELPWRFPSCYIMGQPLLIPLGVQASMLEVRWRAIPYMHPFQQATVSGQAVRGEMFGVPTNRVGSGYTVWDHEVLED